MTEPRFSWYFDRARHRYVIKQGQWIYQEIIPSRHYPAHSRTYVERSVAILNGETT